MKALMLVCLLVTLAFSYAESDTIDFDDDGVSEVMLAKIANALDNDDADEEDNDDEGYVIQDALQADPASPDGKWAKLKKKLKKFQQKLKNGWKRIWLRRKLKKALGKSAV